MKKFISILIAVTCLLALSCSVWADEVISYSFDDNKSLTTVTNILSSGGSAVFVDGFENNGLSLNGTYGIYLGEVGSTFSVSAMVKLTSTGTTDTIFFKNMGTSSSQKWTGVTSNNFKPAFWTHGDGFSWTTVASSATASLNSWANILYVENNGVGSLYVDDKLIGTGAVAKGAGQLYLGVTYWSADAIRGTVDNVILYDYDIKDAEIEVPEEVIGDIALKERIGTDIIEWKSDNESIITPKGKVTRGEEDVTVKLTASVKGETVGEFYVTVLKKPVIVNEKTLLSYKFDEKDGEIIHDISGNGNHGAAYNGLVIGEDGAIFDGNDDYVAMPEGVLYGHDSITIIATLTPSAAQKHVFLYGFGNTSQTGYIFLNPSRPTTNTLRFAATKTTHTSEKDVASLPGIRIGDTNTVVVVISGEYASMYVDGDLVMDGNIGMKVSDLGITKANYLGKSLYDGDPYFAGTLKEFTVLSYCMKASDIKAQYGKTPEYIEETEKEEYITDVSFADGIDVTLDTFGRDDVKVAAAVLDENGNIIDFSVAETAGGLNVTKEGTLVVFAYNEEDNVPGNLYVKGSEEGFNFEYTPGKVCINTENSYENGMVIVAGYDAANILTGVSVKVCDIKSGEEFELSGDFENAISFKMLYWENLVSMVPGN